MTLPIDEIELLPPPVLPQPYPLRANQPILGILPLPPPLPAGPATTGRQSTARMAACPAATTARVGAAHGGGLWRRSGRSPSLLARLARGTSTTARASELQQAPAPAPAAVVPTHKVTVHDRERGVVHHFLVPQDQYILHTAEAQDITLPFACRHGCCTSCAVRIKSGQIRQPEALGISADLREQGYALLCVGYPSSDLEVETQDEDEVYWLQFGRYFARGPVDRDDYALELAMGDE
ncbi:ferredoxin C 2, chloroplastic [Triticum aestivum]|uniref:ferredoxin C 2, chloroplastic n=1 Tax=Triticum aestivum TaxID=4565 RepID=UPI001D017A93|nr:ferredoxin C 2, chloroplastic-like [Triticum aestivum]